MLFKIRDILNNLERLVGARGYLSISPVMLVNQNFNKVSIYFPILMGQ